MHRSIYETADSAQAILDRVCTYEDFAKANPIRSVRNGQGIDVFYRLFGSDWFAVGITREAAEWSRRQTWRFPFDRLAGVVWC